MPSLLSVAVGGAVGAVLRYLVGLACLRWHPDAGPLGTLTVNAAGCFLIGLLMPLVEQGSLPRLAGPLLVTGFLGGLTTFSSFGHETVLLATTRHRPDLALLSVGANLGFGLVGVWLARVLVARLAA